MDQTPCTINLPCRDEKADLMLALSMCGRMKTTMMEELLNCIMGLLELLDDVRG
jgi:hypothetical protein